MSIRKHPYGKAVVGAEEAARLRENAKTQKSRYGKKVGGGKAAPSPIPGQSGPRRRSRPTMPVPRLVPENEDAGGGLRTTQGDRGAEASGSISIDKLDDLLKREPHVFDAQMTAELSRPEGARIGAVRIFLKTELAKDGGGRPEVVKALDSILEKNKRRK